MNGDTESDENQIRDVPYGWWLTGTTLLSIGILLVCAPTLMTLQAFAGGLLIVIGFLIVMFVPAITINIDRMSRTLQVCSRSLLISRAKEFQLQDIASIDAEESDDGGTFRLVITECDGTVTPLRSHYGSWNRELQRRLWKMTGVSGAAGTSGSLSGALQMLTGRDEIVNQEMQDRQELMTAPGEDILESADVSWQLQSIGMGRVPLTRWFSPDFKMQAAFVFIIQKSPSTNPLSRLLSRGIIGRRGILASMAMHGFSDVDAPGKSGARLLDVMALEPHFAVITSDESAAQEILDHSIVRTLIDWATRHPIGGIRRLPHDFKITDSADLGALAVLYGPQGVYAATVGTLASEPLTELGKTGMKLVGAKD